MHCIHCGKELAEGVTVCDGCGNPVMASKPLPKIKTENVLTGVVGALIGAVLGGASIVLLSQLGMVAAISGVILAVCTLKGYELLGNELSTRGIIISCILMAITPYIADRIDWAIIIQQTFADEGVTFGMAFAAVHDVIREADMIGEYFRSLGMVYLFAALGAFGTIKGLIKKDK